MNIVALILMLVVGTMLGLLVHGVWSLVAVHKQSTRTIAAAHVSLAGATEVQMAAERNRRGRDEQWQKWEENLRRDMAHQARMLRVAVGEATGAIRESMNAREDNAALGTMIMAAAILRGAPRLGLDSPGADAEHAMALIKAVIEERRRERGDKHTPFGLGHTFTIDEEPTVSDEEPVAGSAPGVHGRVHFVRDGQVEPPLPGRDPAAE